MPLSCGSWTHWSQSGTLCGTTTSGPSSKFWLCWPWRLCCCCSSTQCRVTPSRSCWVLETLTTTCTEESQLQLLSITQTNVMSSTVSVEQAECASSIILRSNTVTGVVHWCENKLENFPEDGLLKVTWILHMLLKYVICQTSRCQCPIYSCLKILTEFTISGSGQNFHIDYIIPADHCLSTA